jgi:hypothetical protein
MIHRTIRTEETCLGVRHIEQYGTSASEALRDCMAPGRAALSSQAPQLLRLF